MKILFVCTGNLCRSPMAEMLLRDRLKEKNMNNIVVSSAGVMTYDGSPISQYSKRVLSENDIEVDSNFRSHQLAFEDVVENDLILAMTLSHKIQILRKFPLSAKKVYTLSEFVEPGSKIDVDDPYGENYKTYERIYVQLFDMVEKIIVKLGH